MQTQGELEKFGMKSDTPETQQPKLQDGLDILLALKDEYFGARLKPRGIEGVRRVPASLKRHVSSFPGPALHSV